MASPQREKGFVGIANELFERLFQCGIPRRQFCAMQFVLRMTYGFQRKEAPIPSSLLAEHLDIDESDARKTMAELIRRKFIFCHEKPSGSRPGVYGPNKDWEQWVTDRRRPWPTLLQGFSGVETPRRSALSQGQNTPERDPKKDPKNPKHPGEGGQNTPERGGKTPRIAGVKHPGERSGNPHGDSSKSVSKKEDMKDMKDMIPPYPPGGAGGVSELETQKSGTKNQPESPAAAISRITGIEPTKHHLALCKDAVSRPTPPGWDATSWRRLKYQTLESKLAEAVAEVEGGKSLGDPISVACKRAKTKIAISSRNPEET